MNQYRLRGRCRQYKRFAIEQNAAQRWSRSLHNIALLPGTHSKDDSDKKERFQEAPQPQAGLCGFDYWRFFLPGWSVIHHGLSMLCRVPNESSPLTLQEVNACRMIKLDAVHSIR